MAAALLLLVGAAPAWFGSGKATGEITKMVGTSSRPASWSALADLPAMAGVYIKGSASKLRH